MQSKAVLKALVLKSEQTDFEQPDDNARILVAASLEILKELATEMHCPKFDMESDRDKAFLLRAVSEVTPDELTEEDKNVVQILNEFS